MGIKLIALGVATAGVVFGGWASITVENLPDYVIAKQATNLTFSVRQHGLKLLDQLNPSIEARNGDDVYRANAVQTNKPGYYTAKLELPSAGSWDVTIRSGFGNSNVTLMPIVAASSVGRAPVTYTSEQRGQRLFVAKGCQSCHTMGSMRGTWDVGPDLTQNKLSADYLAQYLADPAIKTTRMPNLHLKPEEIQQLIAYLNDRR